jgi:hypothetical protein
MDIANGEFIWFIDADDLAEINLVSALYERIAENDSDLSFCGYKIQDDMTGVVTSWPLKLDSSRDYSAADITCMRIQRKIAPHVCSMLFRRAFLKSTALRFSQGCTAGGDVEFQIKAFSRAEKVAFSTDCLYIYRIHAGMGSVKDTTTSEKKMKRYSENTEAHFRLARYLDEHAASDSVRNLARHFLLPQFYIRTLTTYARCGDSKNFNELLETKEVRSVLRSSYKTLAKCKPEVFLKAMCLLAFPKSYYSMRLKKGWA